MNSFDIFANPVKDSGNTVASSDDSSFHELPNEIEGAALEHDHVHRPLFGMVTVLSLIAILIATQCYKLQVIAGSENRALAQGNSVRVLTLQPDRGLIVDANGVVLAQNDRKMALMINPQTLPAKKAKREATYALLKEKISLPDETVSFIESVRLKSPEPIAIKTNLTKEESLLYTEWFENIPGILLQEIPVRKYADTASLGQLLGYTGAVSQQDVDKGYALNQRVGKNGLEKQYNTELTGTPGKLHAEVNARGEIVRYVSDDLAQQPVAGKSLKLNIDSKLQQAIADALKRELDRRTQKFGPLPKLGASVVVMDPRNGAIKAMVSLPDYPSSLFAQGVSKDDYQGLLDNPGNPLLNRAIQGTYAPGSTLKPLVASASLQEGLITADTTVYTPAALTIGQFRFPDWKPHGLTNTRKAIAESNNIFFYALGGGWDEGKIEGLGVERMNRYLSSFGLGRKTGIDLPSEDEGLLPDEAWKKKRFNESWYIGNTYQSSIGQGFLLATPLQMATGTAAIANGGITWNPRLAQAVVNPETGVEEPLPATKLAENFVDPRHLQTVREGMRQAVESGSARPLNNLKVKSAGKTGTAQFGSQGLTHAWYTGFAPYDNPEIAFAILIEGGGESYYSSVPMAEEVLRAYFNEPVEEGKKLFAEPTSGYIAGVAAEFQGER